MKIKKYIILLLFVPLCAFSAHKYYLSLTQIQFKQDAKSVQIIINVFMDDIELALNKDYNIDLQLTTEKELPNNDTYFTTYLNEKLHIKIDNVEKRFTYIGKEYDGDLVYFYLEIENIEHLNTLEISNKILTKHFPTQQNLVKMKVGKKNKSVLLSLEKVTTLLKF